MMTAFRVWCVGVVSVIVLLSGCKTGNTTGKTITGRNAVSSYSSMISAQKKELEAVLPADVTVESINNGTALKVTFSSGLLFAANSNTLQETAKSALSQFAAHLDNHSGTFVHITGHTDNTGRADFNQTLSERRARSVYDYLCEHGIASVRMDYAGKGFREPIANNNTATGRASNRRVEIVIEMAQNYNPLSL